MLLLPPIKGFKYPTLSQLGEKENISNWDEKEASKTGNEGLHLWGSG